MGRKGQRRRRARDRSRRRAAEKLRSRIELWLTVLRVAGKEAQAATYAELIRPMEARHLHPNLIDLLLEALASPYRPTPKLPEVRPPETAVKKEVPPPPPAPEPKPPPPEPPEPSLPEHLRPIAGYLPFLDAIPRGRELLTLLDRLAKTTHGEQVEDVLREIFVEHLGYEPSRIEQTSRLGTPSAYRRFVTLAAHGRFAVSLLELAHWATHASQVTPCFRVEPYGLVIAVTPGVESIRFVFRRVRGEADPRPWFRTFQGPLRGRDANDSLLCWCCRLHELRPRYGESEAGLRDRVQAALQLSSADMGMHWNSAEFEVHEAVPPGLDLGRAQREAPASFLQEQVSTLGGRLFWGLEAALRNRFPVPLWKGAARIHYDSYTFSPPATDTSTAWRRCRTRAARVELHLHLQLDSGERLPFVLPCSLPMPDERGCFVLRGRLLRFLPRADQDGRLAMRLLDSAGDDLGSDFRQEVEPDEAAPESVGEPPRSSLTVFEGASLTAFLGYAVERKLAGVFGHLISRTWKRPRPDGDPLVHVRLLLRRYLDQERRFVLLALGWLGSSLEVVDNVDALQDAQISVASDPPQGPETPPAWACVDASAERGHRWIPVSAARLHPCGLIALPAGDGRPRLAVAGGDAFTVNPRLGGSGRGPLGWWAAPGLDEFAHLPPGRLEHASVVARCASSLASLCIVLTRGSRTRAVARQGALSARKPRRIHLQADFPVHPDGKGAPRLLVQPGQAVRPGTPWAAAPLSVWPTRSTTPPHLLERLLQRGRFMRVGHVLDELDGQHVLYAPPHASGEVLGAELHELGDRYGLPVIQRLTVVLRGSTERARWIVLPEGTLVRVKEEVGSEELPWAEDGTCADILVELEEGVPEPQGSLWFSGRSGELLPSATRVAPVSLLESPTDPLLPPSLTGRRRLLDLELEASALPSPGLDAVALQWWLATDPESFAAALIALPGSTLRGWQVRLAQVADAVRLPQLAKLHAEQESAQRSWERDELPDPMVTSIKAANEEEGAVEHEEWTCACGALAGMSLGALPCPTCGHEVALCPRPLRDVPINFVELPLPLLHPLYKDAAAAELGLTLDELEALLARFGPAAVVALLSSGDPPGTRAAIRLSSEGRPLSAEARRKLGLGLARLRGGDLEDRLVIQRLPLLPRALQPNALPLGAPGPLSSAITVAYRRVNVAIKRLDSLAAGHPSGLRLAAEVDLQRSVDSLFGPPKDERIEGPAGDLCGLLRRVLPWKRPASLRQGWPGLFAIAGSSRPEKEATDGVSLHWPVTGFDERVELPLRAGPLRRRHVMLGTIPHALPASTREPARPGDAGWWKQQQALRVLEREHLTWLFLLLAAFDAPEGPRLQLGGLPLPSPPKLPGLAAAVAVARIIRMPWARPAELLRLIDRRIPLNLPRGPTEAQTALTDRLRRVFPGSDPTSRLARAALWQALGSWWQGPVSTEHPLGWRPLPMAQQGGQGWRRAVPPRSSRAWALWPGMDAERDPVSFLRVEAASPGCWSPGLRLLFQVPTDLPHLPRWLEAQDVVSQEDIPDDQEALGPVLEPQVEPTVAPEGVPTVVAPRAEVTILTCSILQWLRAGAGEPDG